MFLYGQYLKAFLILITLVLLSQPTQSAELDDELMKMSEQTSVTKKGQQIYESVCFACHGKNLEGAAAPNLRDGEWLHGIKPSEILKTVQKGFPEKGMVEFSKIYSEDQLKSVVAYLLSKQQGLRNVTYKLYHEYPFTPDIIVGHKSTLRFTNSKIPDLSQATPAKTGKLSNNLLDVYIAEVMVYAVEFTADLIIPKTDEYSLLYASRLMPCQLYLNDEVLFSTYPPRKGKAKPKKVHLEKGIHKVKASYFKMGGTKTPRIFFTWSGPDFEEEPLSLDSKKLNVVTHILDLQERPRAYRVTMEDFPAGSIYIGHPEKIHYVFNPKTGHIHGAWSGDYLDIGQAISNRSREPAKIMGEWIYKAEQGLHLQLNNQTPEIEFKGYDLNDQSISLNYTLKGKSHIDVTLEGKVNATDHIEFTYQLSKKPEEQVSLTFPEGLKLKSESGQMTSGKLLVSDTNKNNFKISLRK